jgi:hypothetical protein
MEANTKRDLMCRESAAWRATRQPGIRHAARRAAITAAGFGIASAVVSLTELGLGIWLFGTLLPQHRTATFGTAYHALNRLDGAKMFVLAAMAVAPSAVAISAAILPRWLAPVEFPLGAAIDALEQYLEFFGPGKSDSLLSMLDDLADLFEQTAANGNPIREIVGEDRWSSPRHSCGTTPRVSGSAGSGNG